MKLKHIIALFLSFGSTWYGLAQNHIFIQLYSGETIYYKLTDNPTITYSSTEVNICAGTDLAKRIPIRKIKNIQYTYPKDISISVGIQTGLTAVYTVSGQYIALIKEYEDINKLNLPLGVYILHTMDSSKKILLQ